MNFMLYDSQISFVLLRRNKLNIMSIVKKVVISPDNKDKAAAFFEEIRKKKEEAIKKIELRTADFKNQLSKSVR